MLIQARNSTLKSPLRLIRARKKRISCTSPLTISAMPNTAINKETSLLLARMEVMPAAASANAITK